MKTIFFILCILGCITVGFAQKKQLSQQTEERHTSGLFKNDNAYVFIPEHDPVATSYLNVFHYLQAKVPGLQIYNATTQTPAVFYRMGVPAFYIDEVRVGLQTLLTIPMNDIAYIKVFRPPFMAGFGGGYGAIAVYIKDGETEEDE